MLLHQPKYITNYILLPPEKSSNNKVQILFETKIAAACACVLFSTFISELLQLAEAAAATFHFAVKR